MDDEHAESHDPDLKDLARGEQRVAVQMSTEHVAEHPRRDGEIGSAKENPCDADGEVGANAEKQFDGVILRPAGSADDDLGQALEREIGTMEQPPDDEGPRCAMPQSADEHYDHEVDHGACGASAVAADRNIKIVAQKGGERDVPAAPEIREADRGIGEPEIIFEV